MLKNSLKAINDNFGSKRGLLNYVKFKVLTILGRFTKYSEVDWSRVERLVFVCHGNICRSSLAEGVAKSQGVSAISLGIACREGAPADPRAVSFGKTMGIDLSEHRSQSLQCVDLLAGDLIVVMEPDQLKHFEASTTNGAQLTLAGLWHANACTYIHDPYCANEVFFTRCEQRVVAASQALAAAHKA